MLDNLIYTFRRIFPLTICFTEYRFFPNRRPSMYYLLKLIKTNTRNLICLGFSVVYKLRKYADFNLISRTLQINDNE